MPPGETCGGLLPLPDGKVMPARHGQHGIGSNIVAARHYLGYSLSIVGSANSGRAYRVAVATASNLTGYWPSPWPGEDGGPARRQVPARGSGLDIQPDERLETTFRLAPVAVMPILRDPGEVYLLTCSGPGTDTTMTVERIDPESLEPRESTGAVPTGPFWPGGLAAHANGSLVVVQGNRIHTLDADCTLERSTRLPRERPYNSFVCFPDGSVVTKDFGIDTAEPCEVLVLDPVTHERRAAPVHLPEPSIGRIAADGDTLYVTGITTSYRLHWDSEEGRLRLDDGWHHRYLRDGGSYGWDPCLAGGSMWVMDGGAESRSFHGTFRGCGTAPAPNRAIRVSLGDPTDHEEIEVSGLPNGFQCNVMVYSEAHDTAVAFDAGNGVVAAWQPQPAGATLRWRAEMGHAAHLLVWEDTGELLLGDHDEERGDQVVIVDIVTGRERARAATGSPMQTALFPSPGWGRDLYHTTMAGIWRAEVRPRASSAG